MKFFLSTILVSPSLQRALFVGQRVLIEARPTLANPKAAVVFFPSGEALGRVPRSVELELPCTGRVLRVPPRVPGITRPLIEIEVAASEQLSIVNTTTPVKRRILL